MQVSVEKTTDLGRKLQITVPAAELAGKIRDRMREVSRTAKVQGFRPGKVPQNLIDKHYGLTVREEVYNDVVSKSIQAACEEHALRPVRQPMLSFGDESQNPDSDLSFVAEFEVYPEIQLAPFSSCHVKRLVAEITDADVMKELEDFQKSKAEFKAADRAIALGDRVTLNLTVTLEGEPTTDLKENIQVVVEHGVMVKEMVEALLGLSVGNASEASFVYDNKVPDVTLAGKRTTINFTVMGVEEPVLPELESLTKSFRVDSVDALKERFRERLVNEMTDLSYLVAKPQVMNWLKQAHQFSVPTAFVESEQKRLTHAFAHGKDHKHGEACDHAHELTDEQKQKVDTLSNANVRVGMLLSTIIEDQKLTFEGHDREFFRLLMRFGVENNLSHQELTSWAMAQGDEANHVRFVLLQDLAVETVMNAANVQSETVSVSAIREAFTKGTPATAAE